MKRLILIAGSTLLIASGCSSPEEAKAPDLQSQFALTQFSPAEDVPFEGSGIFHLGAGDILGREIFVNYLAYLHDTQGDDERYATGSNPDPLED